MARSDVVRLIDLARSLPRANKTGKLTWQGARQESLTAAKMLWKHPNPHVQELCRDIILFAASYDEMTKSIFCQDILDRFEEGEKAKGCQKEINNRLCREIGRYVGEKQSETDGIPDKTYPWQGVNNCGPNRVRAEKLLATCDAVEKRLPPEPLQASVIDDVEPEESALEEEPVDLEDGVSSDVE